MMFSSTCIDCNATIMTKNDQSSNPNFRCKSCIKNKKNITPIHVVDIDIKYGPKVIYGWHIPFLSKYLPHYITQKFTQNSVRCDKCFKRFYSDDIPSHCYNCVQNIQIDHVCIKCNTHFMVSPKYYSKHDSMCIDCYNPSVFSLVCIYCKNTFLDSHYTYNAFNQSVCHCCRDTNKLLMNYNINNNIIIDQLLGISGIFVNITYQPSYEHNITCFYCENSDNSDIQLENITKKLPLLNQFVNTDNIMDNTNFCGHYHLDDKLLCANGCEIITYSIINVDINNDTDESYR